MDQCSMLQQIETEKELILRKTQSGESDALLAIFSDADIIRYTNFQKFDDSPSLKVFLERFLQIGLDQPLQYGPYSIFLNEKIIGMCGAQQRDLAAGISELWYILHKDHWGKGLAKRAIDLVMEKCRANDRMNSIYAEAVSSNTSSWKILEKSGFAKTGEIKQGFKKGDEFEDLRTYSFTIR